MVKCVYCDKETDRLYVLRGPDRIWDFCYQCYLDFTGLIAVIIEQRNKLRHSSSAR